jgi:tetratricopeptide (TPR) repeat protein
MRAFCMRRMGSLLSKILLALLPAVGICSGYSSISYAQVFGARVEATSCASAIGGSVTTSNVSVVCGIPPEVLDALVKSRTVVLEELVSAHRETISLLKGNLDLNERQIRAALNAIGENNIAPERLAAKLVEIADSFEALQTMALAQHGDSPKLAALKADAQKAIEAGELAKADALLADVEMEQRRGLDRIAVNAAETSARRGEIALTQLRYREAGKHFSNAAAAVPPDKAYEPERISYLQREASALYQQGDELGDNEALLSALDRCKRLVELLPRERVPLEWAMIQNNLGTALRLLGEREGGTAKLEEAVAAYRDALKEATRERVPLEWAMIQNNLAAALLRLGERQGEPAKLEQAVAAYSEALTEWTRDRVPLEWAMAQNDLGVALAALGEREKGTAQLQEAVAAHREALKEWRRERAPLRWATTQSNLGMTLLRLGERDSGTAKLEEAVAAYREALKERTRERVPLQWATTLADEGVALTLLAERREDAVMAETALSQIGVAVNVMRNEGDKLATVIYERQFVRARAVAVRLRGR